MGKVMTELRAAKDIYCSEAGSTRNTQGGGGG